MHKKLSNHGDESIPSAKGRKYMKKKILALCVLMVMVLIAFPTFISANTETKTLDIADGSITITSTGYTQAGTPVEYEGSYVITGTSSDAGITINGVADGATITFDDLDVTYTTGGPMIYVRTDVVINATGDVRFTADNGYSLMEYGTSGLTIIGDADIVLRGNMPLNIANPASITCNSLTIEGTGTGTAITNGEVRVEATEDISISGASTSSPMSVSPLRLTAGGNIVLTSPYIITSNELSATAGGNITVSSTGTAAVFMSDTELEAKGDVSLVKQNTGSFSYGDLIVKGENITIETQGTTIVDGGVLEVTGKNSKLIIGSNELEIGCSETEFEYDEQSHVPVLTIKENGVEVVDYVAKYYAGGNEVTAPTEIGDYKIELIHADTTPIGEVFFAIVPTDMTAVTAVEDAINALPATITLNDEAAVMAAKSAFDALSAYKKSLVNADAVTKLNAAITTINTLKEQGSNPGGGTVPGGDSAPEGDKAPETGEVRNIGAVIGMMVSTIGFLALAYDSKKKRA